MFQIQLHIIKTDFWRSEAEARRRRLGLERTAHWCCPRRHSGGARAGPQQYGTYTQIRVPPKIWSCKALHGVVTQLLIIVRSVCWLAPVVFPLRIGGVFHVKSCVSAVFWSCVLRRLSAVIHNTWNIILGTDVTHPKLNVKDARLLPPRQLALFTISLWRPCIHAF